MHPALKTPGHGAVWSAALVAATLGRLPRMGGPTLQQGTAATPGTWNWIPAPGGSRARPMGIKIMAKNEKEARVIINLLHGRAINLGSDILALAVTRSGNGGRKRT